MKILNIILFGILIWAVAFIIVSVFIAFKMPTTDFVVKITTTLSVFIATLLLAKSLKLNSQITAVSIGVIWAAIGLALDFIVTTHFTGMSIFNQWNVLLGYLLIIFTPLLTIKRG
ncbi:MAG: hypothetical protein PHE77_02750 [Candidatus Pacebacteria bacterium]|nr:hypothetical protein [Candidatus Paceibacterota bacterium]